MSTDRTDDLLRRAADRAAHNAFFLAADLAEFRASRSMDEMALARYLGCTPDDLPRLSLCRRPDPNSPKFQSDVQRIAGAFGIDPTRLAQILRAVDSLRHLRGGSQDKGMLMAARDAEEDAPNAQDDETGEDQEGSS